MKTQIYKERLFPYYKLQKHLPVRFSSPDSPEEWDNDEITMYRTFKFNNVDYQILIDIVKDHYKDAKGNAKYTKARLLETLYSQHSNENAKFWDMHYYKDLWIFPYAWRIISRRLRWLFNTKKYKREIYACNLMKSIDID